MVSPCGFGCEEALTVLGPDRFAGRIAVSLHAEGLAAHQTGGQPVTRSRRPEIGHADVMGDVPKVEAGGDQDQHDKPDGHEPEDDRRGET
ncbi:hypothetical protein AD948_07245 [Acetobacter senegalensis]|uniref:Uncharacterized protein n=1 Tax=Acetobacter senegalensis TaxID=446692 RepID=A0A149U2Z6_9PROT|nr:hypothetical protein AD948_07245 [Acetobacter senegalensis]